MSRQRAAGTQADDAAQPGADSWPHGARGAHDVREAQLGRTEHMRRAQRLSIRTRLILTCAGVMTTTGMILIALVYFYTHYVMLSIQTGDSVRQTAAVPVSQVGEATKMDTNLLSLPSSVIRSAVSALALLVVLSGTVGWILAGRILQPLSSMSTAAERMASGDLSQRLDLSGPRDGIRDLAGTFDNMLASLERSFFVHRQLAANVSHKLHTPLTTTQTMTDVALSDPQTSTEDLRQVLIRVLETNRTNRETIDALLGLTGARSGKLVHEDVDMETTVRDALGLTTPEAAEHHLRVSAHLPPARVPGDPVLLRQSIPNLLRNVAHYSIEGGRITVGMVRLDGGVHLATRNERPVVAAENVESLRELSVRGEGRGRARGSGHGLGLAIVMAMATTHGGELRLSANPDGGLTAVLELPVGGAGDDSDAGDSDD